MMPWRKLKVKKFNIYDLKDDLRKLELLKKNAHEGNDIIFAIEVETLIKVIKTKIQSF
jgi:hypothetical protein